MSAALPTEGSLRLYQLLRQHFSADHQQECAQASTSDWQQALKALRTCLNYEKAKAAPPVCTASTSASSSSSKRKRKLPKPDTSLRVPGRDRLNTFEKTRSWLFSQTVVRLKKLAARFPAVKTHQRRKAELVFQLAGELMNRPYPSATCAVKRVKTE